MLVLFTQKEPKKRGVSSFPFPTTAFKRGHNNKNLKGDTLHNTICYAVVVLWLAKIIIVF